MAPPPCQNCLSKHAGGKAACTRECTGGCGSQGRNCRCGQQQQPQEQLFGLIQSFMQQHAATNPGFGGNAFAGGAPYGQNTALAAAPAPSRPLLGDSKGRKAARPGFQGAPSAGQKRRRDSSPATQDEKKGKAPKKDLVDNGNFRARLTQISQQVDRTQREAGSQLGKTLDQRVSDLTRGVAESREDLAAMQRRDDEYARQQDSLRKHRDALRDDMVAMRQTLESREAAQRESERLRNAYKGESTVPGETRDWAIAVLYGRQTADLPVRGGEDQGQQALANNNLSTASTAAGQETRQDESNPPTTGLNTATSVKVEEAAADTALPDKIKEEEE